MKHLALSLTLALICVGSATAAVSEVRSVAAPDTLDFPQHLHDQQQNLRSDGQPSATVIRHGRGGYLLVADSLFKPQVISKYYPRKRFMDKAMVDFGGGFNYGIGTETQGTYGMGMTPNFQIGLTDWVTPEHGWRVALQAGELPVRIFEPSQREWVDYNPARFGLSAEYLYNITALASRSYDRPAPAEILLVAGAEADAISYTDLALQNQWTYNVGLHLGLRGILNFSPTGYLYLQPQLGLYKPTDFFSASRTGGEGFALNASLTAGIGIRRDASFSKIGHVSDTLKSVRNDWYFEVGAGLALHQHKFNTIGPEFFLAFGKWFDYTNGFRIRGNFGYHPNVGHYNMYSAEAGADYLWNVSRFFAIRSGDTEAQRSPWSLKFALGANMAVSKHYETGIRVAPGGGVGVQLGVRTSELTEFYLEPRLDIYKGSYMPSVATANGGQWDVVPSLVAGFSFNQNLEETRCRRINNAQFKFKPFQHYFFVQGSVGAITPLSFRLLSTGNVLHTFQPAARLSVGKWFTPIHGLRLYAEGGRIKQGATLSTHNYLGLGAEYLWNITNAIGKGYLDYRPFEAALGVGFNAGSLTTTGKAFNPAFSASLQAHYNIDKRWSIFLEPQLRVYGKDFLANVGPNFDPVASVMIGTQFRTIGYDPRIVRDSTDWAPHGFVGLSAGLSAPLSQPTLGFLSRISFGHWFSPVSGLRFNLGYQSLRFDPFDRIGRQRKAVIGADYLMDFTHLAYGYRERIFHLRPLIGFNVGAGWQSERASTTTEGDAHAGLQLAFSLKHGNEFFIEPQLTYLWGTANVTRMKHFQPALYVGVQKNVENLFRSFSCMSSDLSEIRQYNKENYTWSAADKWYNKWFFELGGGLNMLWGGAAKQHMLHYAGFGGQASVGRWFTPLSGARLRFIGDRLNMETDKGRHGFEMMGLGIDYAHSLTHAIWGYNPKRHIDINAYAGLRLMWQKGSEKVVPGFSMALQPMVNLGSDCSLYLQPEMTFYGKGALQPGLSRSFNFTNALSVGLQVHPRNFDAEAARVLYDENSGQCFFSVAGGGGMPLRNMLAKRNEWFLTGRFSYGHWFTPLSAWRVNVEGWAAPRDFHTHTRSGRMTLGADYMLDVTTLAYSRMDHRLFNFRPLVGFNMGVGYMADFDALLHFQGDVHAGVQMGVNVSQRVELYLEPQLAHVWSGYSEESRLTRVHPTVLAGLTYRLTSYAKDALRDDKGSDRPRHFLSISAGTGFNSHIIRGGQDYFRFKMSVDADLNYGNWFDALNGLRVGGGISTMHIGPHKMPNHQLTVMTLRADYMLNVLNAFRSPDALNQRAELVAYAGLNYNFSFAPTRSTLYGLGGEVGFWAGVKVSPKVTLFLEPTIQVQSPKLYEKSSHPIDGTVRLLGGAKFSF